MMSHISDRSMPQLCDRHHPLHTNTALMILMSLGVEPNRIEILADGESENYKGEIRSQEPAAGDPLGPRDKVVLRVGQYGGFDHLPYQFFYGLDKSSATRTDNWEERARRLMAPFDGAAIRIMARADFEELRFQFGFAQSEHLNRFLKLFGFDAGEPADSVDDALMWVALLPSFNEWAGNPLAVARVLSFLFGYEFEIIENTRREHEIPKELQYHLGSDRDRLGHETILGGSFTDCDSAYRVVVKKVRASDLRQFLPGQPKRNKLDKVLSICMPSHLEYDIEVQPLRRAGRLGEQAAGAYLGYGSFG